MNDPRVTEALERTKENIAVTDLEQQRVDRVAQAEKNVLVIRGFISQIDVLIDNFYTHPRNVRRIPANRKMKADLDKSRTVYLGKLEVANMVYGQIKQYNAKTIQNELQNMKSVELKD